MNLVFYSATGNRFALVDGYSGDWPDDPAGVARELCAGGVLDGVLLVGPPRQGGACRMEVWNADGSRAEMCGNGLRCVGRLVVERGHVTSEAFAIETDVGVRTIHVIRKPNGKWSARAELGKPRGVVQREIDVALESVTPDRVKPGGVAPGSVASGSGTPGSGTLSTPASSVVAPGAVVQHSAVPEGGAPAAKRWHRSAVIVDLGNPHCVFFVDDPATAPVAEVGAALQHHADFPHGTNVEFAAPNGHTLTMRVWERGVGETESCGSGACAAALAAILQGRVQSPVEVSIPGGWLLVERDEQGGLWLTGSVDELEDPRSLARA
jgi:diaminopimelate epimerase